MLRTKVMGDLVKYIEESLSEDIAAEDMASDILNPRVFPEIAVVDRNAPISGDIDIRPTEAALLYKDGWVKEVMKNDL